MQSIYHLAKKSDWENAKEVGVYKISTLGKTYDEVGFIHFSFARQVKKVADYIYKDSDDLILLKIDPNTLTSQVRIESVAGTSEKFPHLYGILNTDSVEETRSYQPNADGTFPEISDSKVAAG